MAAEYQLTLQDYLSILRRRGWLMAGVFAAVLAVVLVVAVAIPPLYESTGTIMVESQQIPTDLVQDIGAINVDERIEVIRQRVMTRENLVKIIDRYKLFQDGYKTLTTTEKIDAMRDRVTIEPISADTKSRARGKVTIAFKVSYDDRDPNVAHRVANDLVTLFLDENVKTRTQRASETTEFLTQETDKLKGELESIENQLATYKQQHGNALPEHLELRMGMVSRTESDLKDVERERSAAEEELRFLEVQLTAAKAGVGPKPAGSGATPQQELSRLKDEYAKLSGIYSPAHPDVRALKRKIDAMESSGATAQVAGEVATADVAMVQAKIAAATSRVNSLAAQAKALRARLGQYESEIIRTPQVERGLVTLMRDHESAQKKYEEMRAKLMNAQVAENLEEENKAERFSLLEPPLRPDKPVKPDRLKILLVGFFLAAGGSGGLAFALETVNQRIRGADALALVMRQRPLVVIPYITTQDELAQRRRRIKQMAILAAGALLVLALLVHFLYMPLDILTMKVVARFG